MIAKSLDINLNVRDRHALLAGADHHAGKMALLKPALHLRGRPKEYPASRTRFLR